jgi:hypothetical protein
MAELDAPGTVDLIRERVRERYAAAATRTADHPGCCGGPTGRAIGLDMTGEMLELARRNAT